MIKLSSYSISSLAQRFALLSLQTCKGIIIFVDSLPLGVNARISFVLC